MLSLVIAFANLLIEFRTSPLIILSDKFLIKGTNNVLEKIFSPGPKDYANLPINPMNCFNNCLFGSYNLSLSDPTKLAKPLGFILNLAAYKIL